jgi:hypothetical protein
VKNSSFKYCKQRNKQSIPSQIHIELAFQPNGTNDSPLGSFIKASVIIQLFKGFLKACKNTFLPPVKRQFHEEGGALDHSSGTKTPLQDRQAFVNISVFFCH